MELKTKGFDKIVKEPIAAEMLGVARGTLRNWRHRGVGPAVIRQRGSVGYSVSDLLAWIDACRSQPS